MLRAALALALAAALPAQVVRIANHGLAPFGHHDEAGEWVRATVDRMPPHRAGLAITTDSDGNERRVQYAVAWPIGDLKVVDLRVALRPGQHLTVGLADSISSPIAVDGPPRALGQLTIAGAPMRLVSARPDGAAWVAHAMARVGPMLAVDVWLRTYGASPGWALAEVAVTASNPGVPDLTATVPAGFDLRFGDALVFVPGRTVNAPLIDPGTVLADGQARVLPVLFVWRQNLDPMDPSVAAVQHVEAVGDIKLWPGGNPRLPPELNPMKWARSMLPASQARLHTFEPALVGPNPDSRDTGAQADQVFVAGECFAPNGVGAEEVSYLGALKTAARPLHHLEVDGTQLDASRHTGRPLIFWHSRPHEGLWAMVDRLGKPRPLTTADTAGWFGDDVEHAFHNNLFAAARLTASPACQWLLSARARVYPLQWTTTPGWSTTQPYASRAVGWEAIFAVQFWRTLEDRALAEAVKAHWLRRWATVIEPAYRDRDVWDIRVNDWRLGPGEWWIPWQQSVACFGLDLAGEVFGVPKARETAWRGAQRVLRDAWVEQGGRWLSRPQMPVAGEPPPADGSFNYFGMSLAVATVRRQDAADVRAALIWRQLLAEATLVEQVRWLAPGTR